MLFFLSFVCGNTWQQDPNRIILCYTQVALCLIYLYSQLLWMSYLSSFVPVSCFCTSAESVSLSRATASVMPPQLWISSLLLLFLKDRFRRAAEAVWLTLKLGLRSRATNRGIPFSFNTCEARGLLELAQMTMSFMHDNTQNLQSPQRITVRSIILNWEKSREAAMQTGKKQLTAKSLKKDPPRKINISLMLQNGINQSLLTPYADTKSLHQKSSRASQQSNISAFLKMAEEAGNFIQCAWRCSSLPQIFIVDISA